MAKASDVRAGIGMLDQRRIQVIRASHAEVRRLRHQFIRIQQKLDAAKAHYAAAVEGLSPVLRSAIVREPF